MRIYDGVSSLLHRVPNIEPMQCTVSSCHPGPLQNPKVLTTNCLYKLAARLRAPRSRQQMRQRTLSGACLWAIVWSNTVHDTSGWTSLAAAGQRPLLRPTLLGRARPPVQTTGVCALISAQSDPGHESKRAKRRRRAPPSELHQWMAALSARPGGLKLLLDLDNNADAVPQLEAAQVAWPASGGSPL